MSRRLLLGLGGLLVAVDFLGAQPTAYRSPWELLQAEHDRNRDGRVSSSEYTRGEERFRRLDRDGDGFITEKDFARARGGRAAPRQMKGMVLGRLLGLGPDESLSNEGLSAWLQKNDADKDGFLGGAELSGWPQRLQARAVQVLDGDGDGRISVGEIETAFAEADLDRSGDLDRAELGAQGRGLREGGRGQGRGAAPDLEAGVPRKGDPAPDFTLPAKDGEGRITLSSFRGKKPVALIFGSYT